MGPPIPRPSKAAPASKTAADKLQHHTTGPRGSSLIKTVVIGSSGDEVEEDEEDDDNDDDSDTDDPNYRAPRAAVPVAAFNAHQGASARRAAKAIAPAASTLPRHSQLFSQELNEYEDPCRVMHAGATGTPVVVPARATAAARTTGARQHTIAAVPDIPLEESQVFEVSPMPKRKS